MQIVPGTGNPVSTGFRLYVAHSINSSTVDRRMLGANTRSTRIGSRFHISRSGPFTAVPGQPVQENDGRIARALDDVVQADIRIVRVRHADTMAAKLASMDLGLRYGDVAVVDSDPAWACAAATLIAQLHAVLRENAVAIEHVGSTAVPGLAAKPIIDLVVALSPAADADRSSRELRNAGYIDRGERASVGDRLFHRQAGPDVCTTIVHVVPEGSPAWQRWLTVRDRLRSDPVTANEYAALKVQLARRFSTDRTAYSRGKAEFLARIASQAPQH